MSTRRAHIVLPEDLVREIDRAVGARKRRAFIAELARRELKRRRLLEILERSDPIWRDEDHPELAGGSMHGSAGCGLKQPKIDSGAPNNQNPDRCSDPRHSPQEESLGTARVRGGVP